MTCPLCGASLADATIVATEGRHRALDTVVCMTCSLVQQSPRPSADEVARYYESGDYYASRADTVMFTPAGVVGRDDPAWDEWAQKRALHQAQSVVEALGVSAGDVVLEVGAGDGSVARLVHEMSGADVVCVEASSAMCERMREQGLRVGQTLADAACIAPTAGYAAAYSLHVVEHHVDPVGELQRLRTLVRESAKVFIAVPHLLSAHGHVGTWLDEAHLQHFTAPTLCAVLSRAGWEPVWVGEHGGELRVVAMPGAIRSAMPRASADEVVAFMLDWGERSDREARNVETIRTLLDWERREDADPELREALRHMREMIARHHRWAAGLAETIDAATKALDAFATSPVPDSSDEALRYGDVLAKAAVGRVSQALGHVQNWSKLREAEG